MERWNVVDGMGKVKVSFLFGIIVFGLVMMTLGSCSESKEVKAYRFLLRGNDMVKKNNPEEGMRFYGEALMLDSCFADAWNNMGTVLHGQRKYKEAVEHYSRAIACRKEYWDAYLNRANSAYESGAYALALSDLEQVEKIKPDTLAVSFIKGLVYVRIREYEKAQGMFEKALKWDSLNAGLWVNLGTVFYYQKEYLEAKHCLDKAETLDKEEGNLYNARALVETAQGNYEKALEWITLALTKRPGDAYYLNNRGYLYIKMGEMGKAVADIDESIMKDPYNGWAYRNKGLYFLEQKDYPQAIRLLKQAVDMDVYVEKACLYLAEAYRGNGEKEQACTYYKLAKVQGDISEKEMPPFCDH